MNHFRVYHFAPVAGLLIRLTLVLLAAGSTAWTAIDLNHDGLGDVWQLKYGATGLSADGDADADGLTNSQEALAGTDPFAETSSFRITSMTADPEGVHFSWKTELGKRYQVQSAASLNSPDWQNEGAPMNGTGQKMTMTSNVAASAGKFYRVLAQDVFSAGTGVSDWKNSNSALTR